VTPAPARTIFVTASGTEIGKTFLVRLLCTQLRRKGRPVRALKPIASGFAGADPDTTDSAYLLRAQGLEPSAANVARITPWAFAQPLSPDMAAAREQRQVVFDELLEFCRHSASETAAQGGTTLIEGIGGVMTPLDERHTVLDWIAALDIPALLVTGSYLGTLSHTLTAAGMLQARRCPLAGVVVSQSPSQPVPLAETVATLSRFLAPTPVHSLPRLASVDADAAPDLTALLVQPGRG
jgi:dethiobiotin synthetase